MKPFSTQRINPNISEAHRLRAWFDNGGGENVTQNISMRTDANRTFITKWKSFKRDNETSSTSFAAEGDNDKPHFERLKTLMQTVACNTYRGCPQNCNGQIENEQFRCERCNAMKSSSDYPQMVNVRGVLSCEIDLSKCKILKNFR